MKQRNLGYSLVEIMVTVAIIATLALGSYLTVTTVRKNSETAKLRQDVANVNRAIQMYRSNGGNLADVTNAAGMLAKLKTTASNAKEIAGLRGTMVDLRLTYEMSVSGDTGPFAIYNALTQEFTISETASEGIKRFVLSDDAIPSTITQEQRTAVMKLATQENEKWVWAFTDAPAPTTTGPDNRPAVDIPPTDPTGSTATKLSAPVFTPAPPQLELLSYPLTVMIGPPQTDQWDTIWRYSGSDGFQNYTGPIVIHPGESLVARRLSLARDLYLDSDDATVVYAPTPVTPVLADTLPNGVTYAALGGPLLAGSAPAEPAGLLSLVNADAFPTIYTNSSVFRAYWTYDGTNPATSGSRTVGTAFSNGYPGDFMPLSLAAFGTSDFISVKYYFDSTNSYIANDSAVTTKIITAVKSTLRKPLVSPLGGIVVDSASVSLSLDTSGGILPVGARIYYRTDGTDPGDNNGEPAVAGSMLWAGAAFTVTPTINDPITVIARVYPPPGAKNWFTTSAPNTVTWTVAPKADPPGFNPPPPVLALASYPLSVSLTNPNDPAHTSISYNTSAAPTSQYPYTVPIVTQPGESITSFIISSDLSKNRDSDPVTSSYVPTPVPLALTDTLPANYTYVDLGGPLAPGSPAITALAAGKITLANGAAIPDVYETSSNFRVYWTMDQSDPTNSATRLTGPLFSNGYTGDTIPFSLATYGNATSVTLKYIGDATGAFIYITDSPVVTKTVGISKITLPAPIVTPASGGNPSAGVTLALNLASGQIPVGARIYYRTDNVDPGNNAGEPNAGATLWTGTPILVTGTQTIQARVYPPATYNNWFNTSLPAVATYTQPVYPNVFASDGTGKIHRFDPATGNTAVVTFGGLFNIAAVAYDAATGTIYYTEDTTTNFRLAKYVVSTGIHTLIGSLTTPTSGTWRYTPTQKITNLSFIGGKLFYIHGASDDLVSIELTGNVITNQVKFADISNGAKSFGVAGDITTTTNGKLWLAAEGEVATFNLTTLNGFTTLRTVTPPSAGTPYYPSLVRHTADALYTNRNAQSTLRPLTSAGAELAAIATNPVMIANDMAAAESGVTLPTVSSPFYAVTGGNKEIWQVNPATGQSTLLNNTAPFNLGALAFDAASNSIYYLEDSASTTWRVGKFNVATGLHLGILGDLKTTGTNPPTAYPGNLVFYNRALFYIHPNSDSLVEVPLNEAADALFDQVAKPLGTTFQTVGDLALNDSGTLYFVNTNGTTHTLYSYNLRTESSLTSIATTTRGYPALGLLAGTLYGTGSNAFAIDSINVTSAAPTQVAHTQPNLTFIDFASGSTAPPPPSVASYWAIGNNENKLYKLDPSNGSWIQEPGTASFNLGAVAWDSINDVVYYVEQAASNWRIGKYDPSTGTHTTLTNHLGSTASGWLTTTAQPRHLVYYAGQLLYIAAGTDELRRIEINSTSITGVSLVASMNGGSSVGTVNAASMFVDGTLFFASSSMLAKFHVPTRTGFTVIDSSPSRTWQAFVFANDGKFYGIDGSLSFVTRTINPTTGNSSFASIVDSLKTFVDMAGVTPTTPVIPVGNGELLAVSSGATEILRVNPNTGTYSSITAATLFQPYSVAYDEGNDLIYYAGGNSAGEFRLAKFSTINSQHVELGNLRTPATYSYTPADRAENLIYFRDGLYYVASGSDDLIKITPSGNSISSQVKVRDLTGNATTWASIGGLASSNLGVAVIGGKNADFFGRFILPDGTGYASLSTSSPRTFDALAVRSNDQAVYAARPASTAGDLGKKFYSVVPSDGAITFTADSLAPNAILDMGDAVDVPPTLPTLYAVGGNNNIIYKFDPTNGNQISWVTNTPFTVESVAVTADESRVYYVERAASGWRLGEYNTATSTHTNRGTLTNAGLGYVATQQPTNLMFQNGRLYYIAADTDDLVAIEFSNSGSPAMVQIVKVADLNNNVALTNIGDLATDSSGTVYISAANAFATWNFVTQSGFSIKTANPTTYWTGLLTSGTNLYGVSNAEPGKLYSVNKSTGAGTFVTNFTPAATFADFASPQQNVQINPAGQTYFISTTTTSIHRLELATGQQFDVTPQVPLNPTGIALDRAAGIIYTIGTPLSGSGIELAKYDLSTGLHTLLGSLGSGTFGYLPTAAPNNLAYFNGSLYYMAKNTDDLVRITLTGNSITTQTKVWDVGVPAHDWDTLAIAPDSTAYLSTRSTHYLARINIAQQAGPVVIKNAQGSDEGTDYVALTFDSVGQMHGTLSHVNLKGYFVNEVNGATTYHWDATRNGGAGIPILDMTSPYSDTPVGVGEQYATDGTTSIFRVNPTTGSVSLLTSSASFTVDALAYDAANRMVYYTENSATNWRLGKYDIAANTHTILGNLDEPAVANSWQVNPHIRPNSLSFFDGNLYYIHSNSDDLIRIDLAVSSIANQIKIADITNGAKSFGITGDITTTAAGILWIAAENEVATFNLNSLSGYLQKRVTTSTQPGVQAYYPGLQRDIWDTIYADRQTDTSVYKLNAAGSEVGNVATNPAKSFVDYAGAEMAPPLPTVTAPFYAVNGTQSIYQVNPVNGQNKLLNNTAPYLLASAAYDPVTNYIFYIESGSSSWRVGRYHVPTNTHLATSMGDLKIVGTNLPTIHPGNLVYYSNALYYIHPSSSNLVKVSLSASLDAIVDQRNISLGTMFQTIGDLALDDIGQLYWVNTNGTTHTLYRYNLRLGSGLTAGVAATRAYPALGFYGGTLYGTGGNASALDSLNVTTGVGTFVANAQPNQTFTDFAAGSAAPPPVLANFYAIGSGNKNIYRLDPTTGQSVMINNTAPYNLGALAFDATRNQLFYLEETTLTAGTWSLGRYDLATGTHLALGDIKSTTNTFGPTAVPQNLVSYSGALYFVLPGKDDLIKIQLDASGGAVTGITRAASMTTGLLSFAAPGDIAADDSGKLAFTNSSGSDNVLYRYDLIGASGFSIIGTLAKNQHSLGFHQGNLYAASLAGSATFNQLNTLTAAEISTSATSPAVDFGDFAGPSLDTVPTPSGALWAITAYAPSFNSNAAPRLVKFNNYKNSGGNVDRVDYGVVGFQNGTGLTPFTSATGNLGAMMIDSSNRLYFVNNTPTTINGVVYERPLFSLALGGLAPGGPVFATLVGDLGSGLRTVTGVTPLTSSEIITGMAAGSDGKIRLAVRVGNGSTVDRLVSIATLTPNASGQLTVTSVGLLQNGAVSVGNVSGMAIDSTGLVYVSDADDLGIWKANATTGLLVATIHSTEPSVGSVAVHLADTDLVTSLPDRTIRKVLGGTNNDSTYFNPLVLWGYETPSAIAFPGLAVTPPPTVTGYFAADGTNSIYRMDPVSGANIVSTTAPFPVQTLAFDRSANRLYYIEAAAAAWRMGRYDVTSDTHSIFNFNLQSPGGNNQTPITTQPQNLVVSNGGLYTILPNTDDLVKIDITVAGIDSIHKVADMNNDVSQGLVNAASIDSTGMLFFASTSVMAKFNLRSMGGYTIIASNPNIPWSSFVIDSTEALYGVRSDDPFKTFTVNNVSGSVTYKAPILPNVAFTDISFSSGPYLPISGYAFASSSGSPSIHRVDLPTARNYVLTWQAKANVEAVAFDSTTATVYYLDTGDNPIRIHAYSLLTDTHTTLRDASFQTDLKLIGTNPPTGNHPHNLTYFNGSLYYIASGTDDLHRITLTSPLIIEDQTKVADIAGNISVGTNVGAFTIDDTGMAYISFEETDMLARFNMRSLGGFTVLNNSSMTPRYYGLTYDSSTLWGIPFDPAVSQKLYTVAVPSGTRTLVANVNPSGQLLDLATSTPNQPGYPAPTANFFAITGGNKNIHRLEPTTGQHVVLNNTAPYNLGAIAYDQATGSIYYLEDGGNATWNIGKYTVSTSTHAASLGNLKSIPSAPTAYPGNLMFYNNALYFIEPNTSKLSRLQLNTTATAATALTTIDLGTTFATVGDLSLTDAGLLYWVSSNGTTHTLYRYNLRDTTGFATVGTTVRNYPALGMLSGTTYGAGGNAFVIDGINVTTGAASIVSTAQPNAVFTDFASGSTASVPAPPVWAIGENGNAQLIRINGYDGVPTLTNFGDIRYPGAGGTLTAWTADSDIESFAVTGDGFAYFVRNKDTNVNSVVYGRPLFRIDLNTVIAGSVTATFLGDLDQAMGTMNGAAITTSTNTEAVSGLTVGLDGALYAVYQTGLATAVDKLFKITGVTVDGGNNITSYSLLGNITNGTNSGTNVDALEFSPAGVLYAFDSQDGELLVVNSTTGAVTSLHSTEAGNVIKDLAISPLNNDFISSNFTGKQLKRVVAPGADTVLFSYNSSPPWTTPIFTDLAGLKFPARNFTPAVTPSGDTVYACTGGNRDIYTVNLATGATVKVVDNAAAFEITSLAYDPVQNTVFYLQDAATGYCLGSWQLATNVHTAIYALTENNHYNSVIKPTNLTWWGGYLWFIEPGTDDLIRITSTPTAASMQTKVRDLTGNTVAFSRIGDLAVDDSGMLYFSAIVGSNSVISKFNMSTLSGYTQVVEQIGSSDYCESIVFGPNTGSSRVLYATRDSARSVIRSINTTTGVISSTSTPTTPILAMLDTSDRHLNNPPAAGNYYAVAGGTDRNIYTVNPETGATSVLTTAPATFAGLSSIAWDEAGGVLYYIEELASNFKLGRYSLDTGTHVSLGSMQGAFAYSPASKPTNLGFMRGGIYYIASGTDDLVRVDVSATAILNQLQIIDLNANVSLGTVGDLVSSNNWNVFFTAGGKLYAFDVALMGPAWQVANFTLGTPDGLAIRNDASLLYGVFNPVAGGALTTQIYKMNTSGVVTTNVSTGALSFRDLAGPDLSRPDAPTRVFIGGDFGQSTTAHRGIARLLTATGALDPAFNSGSGPNSGTEVKTILPVSNGQVLGGGNFSTFGGQPRTGVVRLNADGSVDQSFTPIFK